MRPSVTICLLLIIIGLVVLAWPEQDNLMMIRISSTHGPSVLDSIGLVILFAGYIPFVARVVTKFSLIRQAIGATFSGLLVVMSLACLLLIAVALIVNSDIMLWFMVAISTSTQALLVYHSFRRT